ncbi:MAG TPA: hypothetical protein VJA18_00325 [Candidatus Nanoarchaeia archaeon]|nr:hypothetical protein [Candidatus Nanoarchaeia archaeon]
MTESELLEQRVLAREALGRLAEINKKDVQDYSLGSLIKESHYLTDLLRLFLSQQPQVFQIVNTRLDAIYIELDKREKKYNH